MSANLIRRVRRFLREYTLGRDLGRFATRPYASRIIIALTGSSDLTSAIEPLPVVPSTSSR
jgi:hypothetical protein